MHIKQIITSNNCTIEFAGREVGYLQDLVITAQYNLTQFRNLHQFNLQHITPGIATYTATAQRAFVDITDTVLGSQTSLLELAQLQKSITTNPQNTAEDKLQGIIDSGLLFYKGLQFATNTINDLTQTSNNALSEEKDLGDIFSWWDYFDIAVRNPIVNVPQILGDIPSDIIDKLIGSQTNIMILRDCKFNSRSLSLNSSNIAVMEGLSINALSLNEYANKGGNGNLFSMFG
jgi:hypothetical protein